MPGIVKQRFIDKKNYRTYDIGDIYEGSDERLLELAERGRIEILSAEAEPITAEKQITNGTTRTGKSNKR